MIGSKTLTLAACLTAAAAFSGQAAAQVAWPKEKEVTIIVAVAPGSSAELSAREVGRVIHEETGANVVVKSIVGGGGLTGFNTVKESKADGYTIGLVNLGSLVLLPHIQDVPFNIDSFDFLGAVAAGYYGLGVAQNSPIKNIQDLINLGKQRPILWSTDTPMNGLALVQLATLTGGKQRIVITQTQPESIAQAVGGHTDVAAQTLPVMQPLIEGKEMRLLASTSSTRWPTAPDVPTLKDLGYNAEITVPLGYATPKGVPADIRNKLDAAIQKSTKDPALLDVLKKFSIASKPMTGKEFEDYIRGLKPFVGQVMVDAGLAKEVKK